MSIENLAALSKEDLIRLTKDLVAKLNAQEEGMGDLREPRYDLPTLIEALKARGVSDAEITLITQQTSHR